MTAEQATTYLQALMASVTIGVILPALLMFGTMFGVALMIARAQRKPGFNFEQVFTDESGKVSTWRVATMFAFCVHSAYFYATLFIKPDNELFLYYGLIWGGTPAALIMAEGFRDAAKQWNGVMPFARPHQPGAPPMEGPQ
jgi:hypothetical protein